MRVLLDSLPGLECFACFLKKGGVRKSCVNVICRHTVPMERRALSVGFLAALTEAPLSAKVLLSNSGLPIDAFCKQLKV